MIDHERLHQRLMDGMADPGMYSECAMEIGLIDDGSRDYEARMADQQAEEERDRCNAAGHVYFGDQDDRGRCYCGEVEHPLGGPV